MAASAKLAGWRQRVAGGYCVLGASLIVLLNAIACNSIAAPSDAKVPPYDGRSRAALAAFVERLGKDWPVPGVISYFKVTQDKDTTGLRYAYWPAPNPGKQVGTVVFFSGRTEFIEKNIYTYKDLLDRGYDVWTFDWRGQGLSQRSTGNKEKGHIDSFDTFVIDASKFIDDVVRLRERPGKKLLLAHSMGGQVALRYLLDHPGTFDAAVLSSPLLGLRDVPWYVRVANVLKVSLGGREACVHGLKAQWESDFQRGTQACDLHAEAAARAVINPGASDYTSDPVKIAEIECLIEASRDAAGTDAPDFRLRCPTSGWLRAALLSTDAVMKRTDQLRTPTLIIAAVKDVAVDTAAQEVFCTAAEQCCRLSIENAGHELLVEREDVRQEFLKHFDAFVGSPTPPKQFCAGVKR